MDCLQIIDLIKNIILTIVALITGYVAIQGLNAWKIKLKGQSDYDLSRRLLITLFKYRDAIHGVRSPAIWNYEMPNPPVDEVRNMSDSQISYYQTSRVYKTRWEKVQNERINLYPDLLESEAVWGIELKSYFIELFKLENELLTNLQTFLELKNPDRPHDKDTFLYHMKGIGPIIHDSLNDDDNFNKNLKAEIEKVENFLKPKLLHVK